MKSKKRNNLIKISLKPSIMKLLLLCAVLLFLSWTCLGQAPKKTNLIIVKGATLKEAVSGLLSSGFMIDKIDTTFGIVTTKPKAPNKSLASMIIQVVQKDTALYITGSASSNMRVNAGLFSAESAAQTVSNIGMKGSDMRLCFAQMDKVAQSLGREVEYRIN
jgi:hypothetical protein